MTPKPASTADGPFRPISDLLTAEAPRAQPEAMIELGPETPIETAAHELVRAGAETIVIVDAERRPLGRVSAERLVGALLVEHDEDIARLGGYRSSAGRARRAAEEPLGQRLWHRLPWLVIGLAGAMASAILVGAFERQLEQVVLLALFVPAVVYMASAVGTQTQTVLIRALSTGVDLPVVFRRELLTGLVLGVAVGLLFYPFALLGWGDADVALGVALALFASCASATGVAMALPLALQRVGLDPAFGSGPLATVIQDLLSIAIYFAIAVPIVI